MERSVLSYLSSFMPASPPHAHHPSLQLFILSGARKGDMSSTMLHRQTATVHQLYRALKTSPEILPNTSFAFGTQDQPVSSAMAYARPVVSPSHKRIFPMPHFSFWSWPLPFINSVPAAARAISAIEESTPFAEKDPRAVWRGTTWFNSGAGSHPRLRQELVKAAAGAPWADVQGLEWTQGGTKAVNAIDIHAFCGYKYVIQTEGIGYSGRLQFHQLCESVVLSPPLEWLQHTTHLVRPAFSSTILGSGAGFPTAYERERWPEEYPVAEANMIFVASDWSDLEAIINWLEGHQDVAARIARNQRRTFHEDGYLSPAAEACYWRSLLRVWAGLARPIGEEWEQQGMPAEEFMAGREDGR